MLKHFTEKKLRSRAGKHKLRIVVNGTCPLQPDRLVTCATNYWVGQRLEFTPMWIPALSGIASKIVQWEFGGNFVNDTWQRFIVVGTDPIIIDYYGAVTYSNNPALLTQENTHAWWVSGDQEYHAHIGQHLTFNNGQQVAVTEMGKFKMQRPRLISKNMCQDLSELNLPFDVPIRECLFVSETSGGVSLGEFNGGYARFWASFLSRPGDKFVETQIVNSYRQWGANAPLDSGTNWWFDGEGEKFGGKSLAGEDGVGIIQQTDKYPRIPKDEPEYHLRDIFKTYMRYRPQEAGSIFVTLGRVDWSWSVDGQFANGQWSDPAPGSISAPTWHEDEGFPDWIADTPNPQ